MTLKCTRLKFPLSILQGTHALLYMYYACCPWVPNFWSTLARSRNFQLQPHLQAIYRWIKCLDWPKNTYPIYVNSVPELQMIAHSSEKMEFFGSALCYCTAEQLSSRGVRCTSIKPIFSEPVKQINVKFGERHLFNFSPDIFFFKILHFWYFFYDFLFRFR